MSVIGSPIATSILQSAQAQQSAAKARDLERSATERSKRLEDSVDLKVAEVEDANAVRALPKNESEQAEDEHRRKSADPRPDQPQIDLRA